ncbi:hypothetical protein [Luteolibacter sp. LG18]|uniref:hypothetical protein n=1 Tax=Luteolibacter sp. LG18 TaxID=2819286 RepID=UPI002B2D6662|nr:hypothetical protein llg_12300 [Luteolibacter sp. LG18]
MGVATLFVLDESSPAHPTYLEMALESPPQPGVILYRWVLRIVPLSFMIVLAYVGEWWRWHHHPSSRLPTWLPWVVLSSWLLGTFAIGWLDARLAGKSRLWLGALAFTLIQFAVGFFLAGAFASA